MPAESSTRVVAHHVDTLHLNCRVVISDVQYDFLARAKDEARSRKLKSVEFKFASQTWSLHANGTRNAPYRLTIGDGDVTLCVGYRQGPSRPNVSIEFGTMPCTRLPLRSLCDAATELTERLGQAESVFVHRIDLCADLAGAHFDVGDRDAFVLRSKKGADYDLEPQGAGSDDRETWSNATHWNPARSAPRLLGFVFSRGGPLSARLYDKRFELSTLAPDSEKRLLNLDMWRRAGCCDSEPVWRFEAQIRGAATLRGLGIAHASALESRIDAAWQYVVQRWIRLVRGGDVSRRWRAPVCSRWAPLLEAIFFARASPVLRTRGASTGASDQQALGTVLSNAASRGRFAQLVEAHGSFDGWTEDDLLDRFGTLARKLLEEKLRREGRDAVLAVLGHYERRHQRWEPPLPALTNADANTTPNAQNDD